MNRKGLTFDVFDMLFIVAAIALLVAVLGSSFLASVFTKRADRAAEEKRVFESYATMYEKTLTATVQRLLIDGTGPLSDLDRGKFLENIANGTGSPAMKYQESLAAFAVLDWPEAKAAHKLVDKMHGFIGLMETAEGSYVKFAQQMFNETNEELKALFPEKPEKKE